MKKAVWMLILVALMGVLPAQAQTPSDICAENVPATDPESRQFTASEQVLEDGVDYYAVLCTGAGAVYVDLFENETPATVNNFVFLAQNGYFNNSVFHRVIQDFMVQGGDPVGNPAGTGGPGYQFEDEPVGFLTFDQPGYLAMANAGPATNGSQFFITTVPTTWLNYRHTIFGRVVEGQDLVEGIPDNQADPSVTTALDTVVIITDPSTVEIAAEDLPLATREDIEGVVNDFSAKFSANLEALQATDLAQILGGVQERAYVDGTEEWIARASEGTDSTLLSDYYGSYSHEYHANVTALNLPCDLQTYPVAALNYALDAYATVEDATAAAADPRLAEIFAGQGFEPTETTGDWVAFSADLEVCDNPVKVIRAVDSVGRFVTVRDIAFLLDPTLPAEQVTQIADYTIVNLTSQLLESLFQPFLLPEIQ